MHSILMKPGNEGKGALECSRHLVTQEMRRCVINQTSKFLRRDHVDQLLITYYNATMAKPIKWAYTGLA